MILSRAIRSRESTYPLLTRMPPVVGYRRGWLRQCMVDLLAASRMNEAVVMVRRGLASYFPAVLLGFSSPLT